MRPPTALSGGADQEFLAQLAGLDGLRPFSAEVEELMTAARVVTLSSGDTLIRQDEVATGLFVVIEGWIKIYRITPSGEEAVIHILARGESFGPTVATPDNDCVAGAEAVGDARVILFPADFLIRRIRDTPQVGLAVLALALQQVRHLTLQIEQLKAQTGTQRVAEFISSLCPVDAGRCVVALPYDKRLIAARLGLKPESLSRIFARLKSIGVEVRADCVTVNNARRLREFAVEERGAAKCGGKERAPITGHWAPAQFVAVEPERVPFG
jgi:CRP-like cAMP-binding protein